MSKISDILKNFTPGGIASEGIKSITSGASEIISKFVQDPNQKQEALLELKRIEQNEIKLANENTADARAMNVAIQDSANASFLAKNVGYILDLSAIVIFFVMLVMLFTKQVPQGNEQLFYIALGSLLTYVGTIFNYHRGSSNGSEKKQQMIEKIHSRNQ